MKKFVSILIVFSMLLGAFAALAEMGVQVIGGPEAETEQVSLDDIKLNTEVEIEGWGTLTFTAYEVQDDLGCYKAGSQDIHMTFTTDYDKYYFNSGNEAEFVIIYADILNTQLKDKNYIENVSVTVIYDDAYEYGGWSYQRNYNNHTENYSYSHAADNNNQNTRWAINEADQFAIAPMYQGHYIFGCTLPNAVVDSKKPLRMVITIDGNELTYNIRK